MPVISDPSITFVDTADSEQLTPIDMGMEIVERKAALSQADMDEYIRLSKAYLGGPDIPFEIQLLAYDKHGEMPSGIELDYTQLGDMTLLEWLREIHPLRTRKDKYGVQRGVEDPEALLEVKQRAVVVYTRCALEQAEAEVLGESHTRRVYFPAPSGAKIGKNGYIHLFTGYPDSPVGAYRGDGAAFNVMEVVKFIGKHFPDVEDEILSSLADA